MTEKNLKGRLKGKMLEKLDNNKKMEREFISIENNSSPERTFRQHLITII